MILEKIPMKTSRFSDAQIMAILKQAEDGIPVAQLRREHGMSDASFYIYGLFPRCKLDFESV
jgi:putative transposase